MIFQDLCLSLTMETQSLLVLKAIVQAEDAPASSDGMEASGVKLELASKEKQVVIIRANLCLSREMESLSLLALTAIVHTQGALASSNGMEAAGVKLEPALMEKQFLISQAFLYLSLTMETLSLLALTFMMAIKVALASSSGMEACGVKLEPASMEKQVVTIQAFLCLSRGMESLLLLVLRAIVQTQDAPASSSGMEVTGDKLEPKSMENFLVICQADLCLSRRMETLSLLVICVIFFALDAPASSTNSSDKMSQ